MKDFDLRVWNEAIEALERRGDGWVNVSSEDATSLLLDKRVKDLYLNYMKEIREASERGEFIAGFLTGVPMEIFRGMDIPAIQLINMCNLITLATGRVQQHIREASDLGVMTETCTGHRIIIPLFADGFIPGVKAITKISLGCDTAANSSGIMADHYGIPEFMLDVPNRYNVRSVKYVVLELEDCIEFLEGLSGKKMDWDKLSESIRLTEVIRKLIREIAELRKAIPSPMENRRTWQINWLNWIFTGSQEGVDWLTELRDELKKRVAEKRGAGKKERIRLIDLWLPPPHCTTKLCDWMQEQGISVVQESFALSWCREHVEMDQSKPLEYLAHKIYNGQIAPLVLAPVEDAIENVVSDAIDYKVDGAIFWPTNACDNSGLVYPLKEALEKRVGIPTSVVECDLIDETVATYDQMVERLEEFFETIESRRKGE